MRVGIALGSNIEPREQYLRSAVTHLRQLDENPTHFLCSRAYETSPVDCPPDSALFLNAVVELESALPPLDLLARLQKLEAALGRPADHAWHGPRTIDLDILYCDDLTLNEAKLQLPHPRFSERRFVLEPLCEIRPDLVLPHQGLTIAEILKNLDSDETVKRFELSIS